MSKKIDLTIQLPAEHPKDKTAKIGPVMIGSTGGYADGWLARITLADGVHLQLFPKYGLVAMELCDNGNTNLPIGVGVDQMLDHLFNGEPEIDSNHPDSMEWDPAKPSATTGPVYASGVDGHEHNVIPLDRLRVKAAIRKLMSFGKKHAADWGLRF